jgi:metal-responsive CopG/Arc/MetJ family transcriptional regulator
MTIVSLSLGEPMLEKFEEASKRRGYSTRSEAFREAMRAFIDDSEWNVGEGRSTLILSVLYEKGTTRDQL